MVNSPIINYLLFKRVTLCLLIMWDVRYLGTRGIYNYVSLSCEDLEDKWSTHLWMAWP